MNIIFFVLGLASFLLYFPMEARKVQGHFLETALDRRIPMIPEFVVPYILFFPYVFGVFLWAFLTRTAHFNHLALSLIFVSIITTLIYLEFPSKMVRPFSDRGLVPSGRMEKIIHFIEKFDNSNNVFPSNHVAYSLVITLFLVTTVASWAWLFWLVFVLIATSTVMIKQHYLVDVPAGAAVALLIWYLLGYFLK